MYMYIETKVIITILFGLVVSHSLRCLPIKYTYYRNITYVPRTTSNIKHQTLYLHVPYKVLYKAI